MKKSLAIIGTTGLALLTSFLSVGGQVVGQCPCQSVYSEGNIVYEGVGTAAIPYSPEMELEHVDSPSENINFTVIVDDQAIVTVNGEPTITKGKVRPYIVRGLTPGKTYVFEFKALVRKPQGDVYFAEQKVTIGAGESKQVVLKVKRANRADHLPPVLPLDNPAVVN